MSFSEADVNRDKGGKFDHKVGAPATVTLTAGSLPESAHTRFDRESEWIQKNEDAREVYVDMESAMANASSFAEVDAAYGGMLSDRQYRGRGVHPTDVAALASHAGTIRARELKGEGVRMVPSALPDENPYRECATSAELNAYRQLMTVDEPHRERELVDFANDRREELR